MSDVYIWRELPRSTIPTYFICHPNICLTISTYFICCRNILSIILTYLIVVPIYIQQYHHISFAAPNIHLTMSTFFICCPNKCWILLTNFNCCLSIHSTILTYFICCPIISSITGLNITGCLVVLDNQDKCSNKLSSWLACPSYKWLRKRIIYLSLKNYVICRYLSDTPVLPFCFMLFN